MLASDAVSASVRFNGPLGEGLLIAQQHWLPGTVHISVKGSLGGVIAHGLAVRISFRHDQSLRLLLGRSSSRHERSGLALFYGGP